MKGPSTSVSSRITTTAMQTSERISMNGATHEAYFWSGGKSICLPAIVSS